MRRQPKWGLAISDPVLGVSRVDLAGRDMYMGATTSS